MSINTTLSSVNSSSSTSQVSKSSGSESTKKTSDSSFKEEMNKVTTSEKEATKENSAEVTQKSEVKEETSKDSANMKQEICNDEKVSKNGNNEINNIATKEAELKNIELLKNQQLLNDKMQTAGDRQQSEIHVSQEMLQQNILAEKENHLNNIAEKRLDVEIEVKEHTQLKDKQEKDIVNSDAEALLNPAIVQQTEVQIDNNYNVDTHKTEESELLSSSIIFNNTLTNFDVNNNELSNDIQQMINISSLKTDSTTTAVQSVGTMSLNSSNKISMTQSDAEFFVNLTQNNEEVTVQNITAQATEMTKQGAEVKEVEKNVEVSQTLLNALSESREKNQPLRIDFDQNISVILRVNKDGVISANFLPHDKAVEQYLRNNIETLKNSFNENDLPYSDLSYSNRGGKQQKEQQRNRQQQQQ